MPSPEKSLRSRLQRHAAVGRDRWRRRALLAQGAYYVVTGVWPLLHFSSYSRAVAIHTLPFQAHVFGAVMIVIGGYLIEAARHGPPEGAPTLLGIAVAAAIAVISLFWLTATPVLSVLWLDLVAETAFAVTLVVNYPRPGMNRGPSAAWRR